MLVKLAAVCSSFGLILLFGTLIYQSPSLSFTESYRSHRSKRDVDEPPVQRHRLPQALIVGVKKGGTRALLEFLRIHPDVAAPGPEIHFFDRYFERGLEWYRKQMPPTKEGQLTVEKTPSYFVNKEVPARIAAMNPNMKLLLVVRNPVTRALSDFAQNSAKRGESFGTFESHAFYNETSGEVNPHWGAIRIGLYWRYLRRYLKYFPLSNIHVVSGERLITHPATEMKRVEQFLNLSPVISPEHFYFNATKGFPCIRISASPDIPPHCLGKTKGRPHPVISTSLMQRLSEFYRPYNEQFYALVGRNFGW